MPTTRAHPRSGSGPEARGGWQEGFRRVGRLLALLALAAAPARAADEFHVLCYHDIVDDARGAASDALSVHRLVEHFEWLKAEGWTVVSLDDVRAARDGRRALPPRAVVLTFDDGYRGFATRVLPLLEAYRYPAVLAFVTEWLEAPPGTEVDYGGTPLPRDRLVSPEELRRLAASPWVEIASHSHALHRGLPANREGNTRPAAVVRVFDPATGASEDDAAFRARIQADLARSAGVLERLTGRRPRTLAWPYGRHNALAREAARAAGFDVLLTLEPARARTDALDAVPRFYPSRDPRAADLAGMLGPTRAPGPHRFITVDPADVVGTDGPAAREERLGRLIEHVRRLGLTAVHLDAFPPGEDGAAEGAVHFPGTGRPMAADYLGRLAWQLRTRAGVDVILRVPLRRTDEADWRALGRHVPFAGVHFPDFVAGRDDASSLRRALGVLREYEPEARLLLSVAAWPEAAGDWAGLGAHLLLLPVGAGPEAWQAEPAARGRVVGAEAAAAPGLGDRWLARGVPHVGIVVPAAVPEAGPDPGLGAQVDPFRQP